MTRKLLLPLLMIAAVMLLIAGVTALRRKPEAEESAEESSAYAEVLVLPSEMPEGISLQIPDGFTETASAYYDRYYVKDDASVIITGEPLSIYGMNADQYADGVLKQYEQTADDFRLISNEDLTAGQIPCKLLEFTYVISGSEHTQEMECSTGIMIYEDYAYLITCKSHRDTYLNYRAAFRQMIQSIQLKTNSTETTEISTETAVSDKTSFT